MHTPSCFANLATFLFPLLDGSVSCSKQIKERGEERRGEEREGEKRRGEERRGEGRRVEGRREREGKGRGGEGRGGEERRGREGKGRRGKGRGGEEGERACTHITICQYSVNTLVSDAEHAQHVWSV